MSKLQKNSISKLIFVLSLRQIIGPKSADSVNYLSKVLLKSSSLRYLPYLGSFIAYSQMKIYLSFIEPILHGNVDNYREGKIDKDVFFENFLKNFSGKLNQKKVEKALEIGSQLDQETLEQLVNLVKLNKEKKDRPQIILAITCDLTPIQYDHILKQINNSLEKEGLESIKPKLKQKESSCIGYNHQKQTVEDFILIESSHQNEDLEEPSLAFSLINRYELDSKNNLIMPLNSEFTKENMGIHKAFFDKKYGNNPEFWYKNIVKSFFKESKELTLPTPPESPISFTGPKFSGSLDKFSTYGK